MPEMKMIEVTAGELCRDDIVWTCESNRRAEGDVVVSKSFGRSRYKVTFRDGPIRAFYSGDKFTVQRMVATEEEEEERERRHQIHMLRYVYDRLATTRHEEVLREALESENRVYLDWSRLGDLIESQERARYAEWITGEYERFVAATGDELLSLMGAFGVIVSRREDRYPRSPLSRSTSATSNLIEDVAKFVEDDLIHDAGYHGRWTPADFLAAYKSCVSAVKAATEAA